MIVSKGSEVGFCECFIIERRTILAQNLQLYLIIIVLLSVLISCCFERFISKTTDTNGVNAAHPLHLLLVFEVGQTLRIAWSLGLRGYLCDDIVCLTLFFTCAATQQGDSHEEERNKLFRHNLSNILPAKVRILSELNNKMTHN